MFILQEYMFTETGSFVVTVTATNIYGTLKSSVSVVSANIHPSTQTNQDTSQHTNKPTYIPAHKQTNIHPSTQTNQHTPQHTNKPKYTLANNQANIQPSTQLSQNTPTTQLSQNTPSHI